MDELTVRDAADLLHVHPSRVRELIGAGTLPARRVGRQWVIAVEEVERQQALTRAGVRSRTMSPRVAWAAGALLDGHRTDWLSASERSRLGTRLRRAEGTAVFQRWLATRHTEVTRHRIADTEVASFLHEPGVVASGSSAARHRGAALSSTQEAEVYLTEHRLEELDRTYLLVASAQGNLLVHHTDGSWHEQTQERLGDRVVTPRLITAVDLLDSPDSRRRAAGRDLLLATLEAFRAPQR